ncbi:MAG: thiol peroxidase [Planctomycetota bacterium]
MELRRGERLTDRTIERRRAGDHAGEWAVLAFVLLAAGSAGCCACPIIDNVVDTGELSMAKEYPDAVTMKGDSLTLLAGEKQPQVGSVAPDFHVVDGDFNRVTLADFEDQVLLISAVPSLDTGVCATQTKRFNEEAATLPDDVAVLTVSMDLPFAQKRFCEAEKVDRVRVLSDHVWHSFGLSYGVLVKDMGLLARSIWVIDRDGKIVYKEVVSELTHYPNYDAALDAVRAAAD